MSATGSSRATPVVVDNEGRDVVVDRRKDRHRTTRTEYMRNYKRRRRDTITGQSGGHEGARAHS